jgi:hypothetical protein
LATIKILTTVTEYNIKTTFEKTTHRFTLDTYEMDLSQYIFDGLSPILKTRLRQAAPFVGQAPVYKHISIHRNTNFNVQS